MLRSGKRDQLLGAGWQRKMRDQQVRRHTDFRDRGDIVDRIRCRLVERSARRKAARSDQDGIAIRLGFEGQFYADQSARSAAIVDHELSPQQLREFLRNPACKDVGAAAGRERHDNAHRLCGISLGENR